MIFFVLAGLLLLIGALFAIEARRLRRESEERMKRLDEMIEYHKKQREEHYEQEYYDQLGQRKAE